MTASWVDRVRTALQPTGYYHDNKFRKSLQTAVLFEALRSVNASSANQLKSYERKYALLQQAELLLDELVQGHVMTPPQRDEVLWKTASSRQILDAPTAWKRVKAIERELNALALQVRPFLTSADDDGTSAVPSSHDDAVDQMVRAQYVRIGRRRSCGCCYGRCGSCCWAVAASTHARLTRARCRSFLRNSPYCGRRRPTPPTTSRPTGT
jgi:hypothetical protein